MKPIQIKVIIEIESDLLLNVMSSACDNSHWFDEKSDKMLEVIGMYDGDTTAERMYQALLDDVDIPINNNDGMHITKLSSKGMNYRLQGLYNSDEFKWAILNELSGDGNEMSSDIMFQYMCFGAVIY